MKEQDLKATSGIPSEETAEQKVSTFIDLLRKNHGNMVDPVIKALPGEISIIAELRFSPKTQDALLQFLVAEIAQNTSILPRFFDIGSANTTEYYKDLSETPGFDEARAVFDSTLVERKKKEIKERKGSAVNRNIDLSDCLTPKNIFLDSVNGTIGSKDKRRKRIL